ncbi:hypothetical protein SEA_VANLEE_162 [Gordonia phage VanLee]|uniref:Uncharacterized protein n=1 Tax=Gordonia phage VanLee TaxID=2845816 RepID=A0A8F2D9W0_9CAUD|nr:hypothetical protein QEH49_gp128 [Gordonia phage VanLee]QWS68278.1 hypothetical protein SEA_VANLEE_162 [Gordonia phage VanLee]
MRTNVEAQDMMDLSAFIRAALPEDFADLLGALFTVGFNYSIENRVVDDVPTLTLQGYRVDREGEPVGDRSVVSVWEYRGGEWVVNPDATGLHRILKSGAIKIETRTVEKLVDYVGERVNDWEIKPVDTTESESTDEVIDDGVTDEVIDEPSDEDADLLDQLRKSVANAEAAADPEPPKGEGEEQPALEAPKPKRGGRKTA